MSEQEYIDYLNAIDAVQLREEIQRAINAHFDLEQLLEDDDNED